MDLSSTVESRLIEERDALERQLVKINNRLYAQELMHEALRCPGRHGLPHDWKTFEHHASIRHEPIYSLRSSIAIGHRQTETSSETKCRCERCPATMTLTNGDHY